MAQQQIVLIGGAKRSGTTVIHRALCSGENTNPYISESWFLSDIMRLYHWNLTRYEIRHADQFGDVQNFRELILQNIRHYMTLVSVKYGDPEVLMLKHPELTYHFAELSQHFPAFKFIVIVRDPRDVIASIKRVANRHNEDGVISPQTVLDTTAKLCSNYARYYANLGANIKSLENRILYLKYEDFVRNPNEQLIRITRFCGARYVAKKAVDFLPEHGEAPNFDKAKRTEDAFSGAFWSDMHTQPLSDSKVSSFRNDLSESDITEIEARLKPFGAKFGYWQ